MPSSTTQRNLIFHVGYTFTVTYRLPDGGIFIFHTGNENGLFDGWMVGWLDVLDGKGRREFSYISQHIWRQTGDYYSRQ